MKISIIGASQGTGALAVRRALDRGDHVTAFARNPQRLMLEHPKLDRMQGDFHDPVAVDSAIAGQDAVIITASSTTLRGFKAKPTYFSEGTAHVIAAMHKHSVKRLVVLSAIGVGESQVLMGLVVRKLVIGYLLRLPFADHERQEAMVRASGLDWVIARPGRLTNGPANGRYQRTAALEKVPGSISRADVADFLIEATGGDTWLRKAVQLGG